MNIEEYIASGLLEQYALDSLSIEQRLDVESNIDRYPALKEELEKIEIAIEEYAILNAKQLSKQRSNVIWDAIKKTINTTIDNNYQTTKQLNWTNYFAIAACLAAVMLAAAWALQYNKTQTQLVANKAQQDSIIKISAAYTQLQYELATKTNDLQIVSSSEYKKIVIAPTDTTQKSALAQVYYNKKQQKVFVQLVSNEPLPQGKQYQLWALYQGKPIDAGVIAFNAQLQASISMPNAEAFAITIEPMGGSKTPTMQALVALGTI